MNTLKILVRSDLPALEQLWRDIERAEHPGDNDAGERAVHESRRSLSVYDYLNSDFFWILGSAHGDRLVGYAATARIPKADARIGFLFIDELYVLPAYRRQGHATRLLEMAVSHAMNLRLGGIRLLVDPPNAKARHLYSKLGLVEQNLILCERSAS